MHANTFSPKRLLAGASAIVILSAAGAIIALSNSHRGTHTSPPSAAVHQVSLPAGTGAAGTGSAGTGATDTGGGSASDLASKLAADEAQLFPALPPDVVSLLQQALSHAPIAHQALDLAVAAASRPEIQVEASSIFADLPMLPPGLQEPFVADLFGLLSAAQQAALNNTLQSIAVTNGQDSALAAILAAQTREQAQSMWCSLGAPQPSIIVGGQVIC